MNAIIGIGRGLKDGKLNNAQWSAFQREVQDWVEAAGFEVLAIVSGDSNSDRWGDEEAAWIAIRFLNERSYVVASADLRESLAELARQYGQDSIALTTGTTHLIGAA